MVTNRAGTVVVVEDDSDALEILMWLLESTGYRVFGARDGSEALALLRHEAADLVLLDLQMPGLDGWQFRERQRTEPRLASIPVVVLTGDRRAPDDAVAADAAGFLRKPIEAKELLPLVARVAKRTQRDLSVAG